MKEVSKKKKQKASKEKPKKPFASSMTINGETIHLQTQSFAREFQKRTGRITDG